MTSLGCGTPLPSAAADARCSGDVIATQAIADNNLSSTITVVPKRSTDMEVGPGLDMLQRADVVVSEILDTELIGEVSDSDESW